MMNRREGLLAKMAYGCGDIYGGGSFLIVGVLLLAFLTNVEGLSGTMAGIVLFSGKLWDAVTDPFMGILSDRTKSSLGRRRIYFLFGSIPVLLSWIMLWYSFGIPSGTVKLVYYVLAFMFFSSAFTIVMIPYNSILPDMTSDYNKRSAFTGVRLSFSAATAIICATVPAMITGSFGNQKTGYLVMAVLFGIIFAVSWLIVFFGTWENRKDVETSSLALKDWLSVFKNRSFRQFVVIFIMSNMAIDVTMALAVYFIGVSIRKQYLYIPAMAAILVVQLLFMMLFSRVAQNYSKKIPALISATVWIAANAVIFTFSQTTPDWIIVSICALIGVGAAGCNLVAWSVLPDISDVDELMTGRRREGLYAGVSTFLRKLSGGIMVGFVGVMLDIFKYSSVAVKSGNIEPMTDIGVRIMFCGVPIIFLTVLLFALKRFVLDKKEFIIMQNVLEIFRNTGSEVVLENTATSTCEQLTGVDAKSFYGK